MAVLMFENPIHFEYDCHTTMFCATQLIFSRVTLQKSVVYYCEAKFCGERIICILAFHA